MENRDQEQTGTRREVATNMSKQMVLDVIREHTGCTHAVARQTADALFEGISRDLRKNGRFILAGFGVFSVRKLKARNGVNPATGDAIRIKPSKTVRFRASRKLKSVV